MQGLGTWSWGNQFLWGYNESMDSELQELFNLMVDQGVNLFDTADSYGTGRLNGRFEILQSESVMSLATVLCAYAFKFVISGVRISWVASFRSILVQKK